MTITQIRMLGNNGAIFVLVYQAMIGFSSILDSIGTINKPFYCPDLGIFNALYSKINITKKRALIQNLKLSIKAVFINMYRDQIILMADSSPHKHINKY